MAAKGFIFDFDGVLINSKEAHRYSYLKTAEKYGLKLDKEKLEEALSLAPGKNTMAKLYPDMSKETLGHLHATQKEFLASPEAIKMVSLIKEGIELVYSLHTRELPMAIITNSTEKFVAEAFHQFSIPELFDYVLPKKDQFGSKTERFEYILGRWKLPAEQVLYVGDTLADVELGRMMGTKVAIVFNKTSWSWPSRAPIAQAQPNYILDNVRQILELLPKA